MYSEMPDSNRRKVLESLRDSEGKPVSTLKYIGTMILAVIVVNIAFYIPKSLEGTKWEWLGVKIQTNDFYQVLYIVIFVIVVFLIFGLFISVYEAIKK